MTKGEEQYYLNIFSEEYAVPDKEIIEIMRKNAEMLDPDYFDYDYWENLCREELKNRTQAIGKEMMEDIMAKIRNGEIE